VPKRLVGGLWGFLETGLINTGLKPVFISNHEQKLTFYFLFGDTIKQGRVLYLVD